MLILSFPEVVEHCCSITSLQLGETLQGIAKDMDTMSFRMPLGVTAGITPFNFPAMIPLWVSILYNHTIYLAVYTTGLMIGPKALCVFKKILTNHVYLQQYKIIDQIASCDFKK